LLAYILLGFFAPPARLSTLKTFILSTLSFLAQLRDTSHNKLFPTTANLMPMQMLLVILSHSCTCGISCLALHLLAILTLRLYAWIACLTQNLDAFLDAFLELATILHDNLGHLAWFDQEDLG
jgi:hypothetical protein